MINVCTGAIESTKSDPKTSGVCRSWGWKASKSRVASLLAVSDLALRCLHASLTMAAAIPALIALGYSLAFAVFHDPSGFCPIK